MATESRPLIGITLGDPCGVGPEIIVKALAVRDIYRSARPVVVGSVSALQRAMKATGIDLQMVLIKHPKMATYRAGVINVLRPEGAPDVSALTFGQISARAGEAAGHYIAHAVEMAVEDRVRAIVTAPINKESFHLGGYNFSGHTEFLAHLTKTKSYAMLLLYNQCRVAHVSTHVSLREACDRVRRARVLEVIRLGHEACRRLRIARPRLAVAGLNPHAGENGLFGREEIEEIIPAVEEARRSGITVDGPLPADTLYAMAFGGRYDLVVAMYHDQGHIPLKMTSMRWSEPRHTWRRMRGVNVTLGLPIIRVSVDHGTAFDIAGKGVASADSLLDSIEIAVQMARSNG